MIKKASTISLNTLAFTIIIFLVTAATSDAEQDKKPRLASKKQQKIVPTLKTLTVQQLVKRIMPSIVRLTVLGKDGTPAVQGSGFVVGYDLIATNFHVVQDAHSVTANFENGRSEAIFGVVGYDSEHDLVLLRAFTKGIPALPLEANTNIQVGDPIVAFGSPEGLGGSISTGVVSGVRLMNGSKVIQTTAPISHGSSGGALVDMKGRAIGVTSFFYKEGQNLNFAYPAYYVQKMMGNQFRQIITWKDIESYGKEKVAETQSEDLPKPTSQAADTSIYTEKPLAGLKGIKVIIGDVDSSLKSDGFDATIVKTNTEAKLRESGVLVVPKAIENAANPTAVLSITVSSFFDTGLNVHLYSIHLSILEYSILARRPAVKSAVETWTTGGFGFVGKSKVPDLSDDVKKYVNEFVAEYLSQNSTK